MSGISHSHNRNSSNISHTYFRHISDIRKVLDGPKTFSQILIQLKRELFIQLNWFLEKHSGFNKKLHCQLKKRKSFCLIAKLSSLSESSWGLLKLIWASRSVQFLQRLSCQINIQVKCYSSEMLFKWNAIQVKCYSTKPVKPNI